MRRKTVSKRVAAGPLGEADPVDSRLDCFVDRGLVQMMTTPDTGARISGNVPCREYVLPAPVTRRVAILSLQSVRQVNRAITLAQILRMGEPHTIQMLPQKRH